GHGNVIDSNGTTAHRDVAFGSDDCTAELGSDGSRQGVWWRWRDTKLGEHGWFSSGFVCDRVARIAGTFPSRFSAIRGINHVALARPLSYDVVVFKSNFIDCESRWLHIATR